MSASHGSGVALEGGGVAGAGVHSAPLAGHDVLCVRAPNPGPLTLEGTNTWIVGREPAWVVDPGPMIEEHVQRVLAELQRRGGLGGVVLTHDHSDHGEALTGLLARYPAKLAAGGGEADVQLADGMHVGPFEALATPGHAPDHFALIAQGACFTGDAVLGSGSVFISPHPGAMSGYLEALGRLIARSDIEVLCPGHGPAVWDPAERLQQYVDHRLDRERRLLAALDEGRRTTAELLDTVWAEVPQELRPAASATLAAHLDRLKEMGRLPDGVECPDFDRWQW
jgi:glyoxylase-like metal-dependent hydrolase (beta-lactamase superfamily II)